MRATTPAIQQFLASGPFAVVGASADRAKYGNKVLRCYLQHGLPVVGIHPKLTAVEGVPCFPDLASARPQPRAVSVVAPPAAAAGVVAAAQALGIRHLWFQPGAEDAAAVAAAVAAGIQVLANGPCVLVALGFHDD